MPNYALTVTGSTFDGNTSTLQPTTKFTPAANFRLPGTLVVTPGINKDNASGNGVNGVDVGLFVGNPLAVTPAAGSIDFVTNSALLGFIGGSKDVQAAAIDDVVEGFNPATHTLTLAVDPRLAPTIQLNEFDKTGGLLGFPSPILNGNATLTFSPDNQTVTGTVTFAGGGFIEPTTTAWSATFIGTLIPGS
jgi:hypothetical protein